jgi:hypothetical protein
MFLQHTELTQWNTANHQTLVYFKSSFFFSRKKKREKIALSDDKHGKIDANNAWWGQCSQGSGHESEVSFLILFYDSASSTSKALNLLTGYFRSVK